MPELPLAAIVRLIRAPDPTIRVSENAAAVLREKLEEVGTKLSVKAKEYALHANRKTITAADITLAVKDM
jgi:histone H3/H4